MGNGYLACSALLMNILLVSVFFSKKRILNIETKIFKYMVIVTLFNSIITTAIFFGIVANIDLRIVEFLNRIDIINIITWCHFILFYIISISHKKVNKFIKISLNSLYVISFILALSLDINLINENGVFNSTGLLPSMGLIVSTIYIILMIISILTKNSKKTSFKDKRYYPIYVFVFIMILVAVGRVLMPEFNAISLVLTFVTFIMFFTIENPDLKLINELNLAKDSAVKANRAKSDFLSSMSHEIRTPLNAIVGFSNMIVEEKNIDDCKKDAKYIIEASQILLEIVNGILDISKIEANKMEVINKHYDLKKEMTNLTKLITQRIGDKAITFNLNIAPDIPSILEGDISKVKQIMTNILTNSIKYTDYGQIDFDIRCVNKNNTTSLVMSVKDTGRGIKTEKINNLFNKFDRLDEDKNTTIEGTGLGLAITKSLIELLGGKIVVQSEYGEGSIFTVYLNQKIISLNKLNEEEDILELTKFSGKEVLIVDDNILNLKIAEKTLQHLDITTVSVNSGNECLKLIRDGYKPDLILMDDMMPEMTGTETFKILKDDVNFKIKTIVLTANAIEGMEEKYLSDGFDGYLAKPFDRMELNSLLSNLWKEKKDSYKKILLIDDNKINLKVLDNILNKYDFEIHSVTSGKEGIELVKNNKYDLIFIDYMMPEMDGIEVLNIIKTMKNFKAKFIMVTADAKEGSEEKFIEAGFDYYVAKPVDKKIINDIVNKYMEIK